MSDISENNSQDGEILLQAAEYYLALQDNSMTSAELKAWQAWFLRSKEHQEAFRRLETLWGVLDNLSIEDFESVSNAPEVQETSLVQETSGAAFTDGSVLSLISQEEEKTITRPVVRWAQAIAACLAVVVVAGYLMVSPNQDTGLQPHALYETASTEQRVVQLSDGSILELGPDSVVDVGYTPATRKITLVRGQAVFTVAKNPNRPFVVSAGSGSVTAIGTVFNVRKRNNDIEVRVLEGTVAVRPVVGEGMASLEAHNSPVPVALVTAGLQTQYGREGQLAPITEADVHAGLDWRVGVLTMVNRQLGDVIQELNRFVENEITIGDEAISAFNFTGTVYPDRVDDWLAGLQQGYPLKVVRVGSSTVLMLDDTDTAGSSPS